MSRAFLACAMAWVLALPLLGVAQAPRPVAGQKGESRWTSRSAPDGTEIALDLPDELHQRNTGGSDGAGLCVYASARHSGRWHDEPVFAGMFDYMKTQPGGSYPTKFARTVKTYAALKGLPEPHYLSVEGLDLDALELAVRNGYMPGVTVMNGAHMVTLVGAREGPGKWWVVLDNNAPHQFRWYTEAEFVRTHTWGGNGKVAAASAWSVIPLTPGPPPPPRSSAPAPRPAPPARPDVKPCPPDRPCPRTETVDKQYTLYVFSRGPAAPRSDVQHAVLGDPAVRAELQRIRLVEVRNDPALEARWRVTRFPTLIVASRTGDGAEVEEGRRTGVVGADALAAWLGGFQ